MSLAIFAAPFNNEPINNFEENDTLHKKKMSKTLKKYPNVNSYNEDFVHKNHKDVDYNKVNQVMKAMSNLPSHNDELGEFKPLPPPISSGVQSTIRRESFKENMSNHTNEINPVNEYKYSSFEEEQTPITHTPTSFYKNNITNIPSFSEVNETKDKDKEPLMDKINYMIHLLEEQQDEKTGNVTEEVILYSFLGIFIIFIVDSFYYVGKYTR
jgi:hypothetical protein